MSIILLAVAGIIAQVIANRRIPRDPRFKYLVPAFMLKAFFGLLYCFIYLEIYGGGDTTSYFQSSMALANLFWDSPFDYFEVLLDSFSIEQMQLFTDNTGYPLRYLSLSPDTYMVIKFISFFAILGGNSYLVSTVLLDVVLFLPIWQIFLMFCKYLPHNRSTAFAFLAIPSVGFWSSGIGKDGITFSAAMLFVYAWHKLLVERRFDVVTLTLATVAISLILIIKAYIFIAVLLPLVGWFVTTSKNSKVRSKNPLLIPILIAFGAIVFLGIYANLDLGEYSMNNILSKAQESQEDLTKSYYGSNSFNIGAISPTALGLLSKIPIATWYGIFSPAIWDVANPLMLASALENTFILILFVYVIFKLGIGQVVRQTFNYPVLNFCLLFTLVFGFSLGLTTANFGALIRFKIPFLPFAVFYILSMIYIIQSKNKA